MPATSPDRRAWAIPGRAVAVILATAPCFLVAVVPSGTAHAAAACDGTTQTALDQCAENRRVAADKRLNAVYGRVLARLRDPDDRRQRNALAEAERAWIGFRDAECAFEGAGSFGGSMNAMVLADCAATLSDARARTLADMAACHARDGSCVLGP